MADDNGDMCIIENTLRNLSIVDRLTVLLASLIVEDGNALNVIRRMINATTILSRYHNQSSRFAIAEMLRDAADKVEGNRIVNDAHQQSSH